MDTPAPTPPKRPRQICPAQIFANGLQILAFSAATGRNPAQLNIALPDADIRELLALNESPSREVTAA